MRNPGINYKVAGKVLCTLLICVVLTRPVAMAQEAKDGEDATFKPSGKLWGLAYGDFAFKAQSDSLNRGGVNQYTGIKKNQSMFQFRRIYLGYDYHISEKFDAEFLLASEDNETTTATPTSTTSGDLLSNSKLAPFIKLANIKWKKIYPGADLIVGQAYTPAAVLSSEVVWDYRCIERTVSDIRRTPTYDFGAAIRGRFYSSKQTQLGYNIMVGNGSLAKPENDAFKWFYGDVYAKLFNKCLIIDLYGDYNRMNWTTTWHHDRAMAKAMIAYTAPKFTIGVEAFVINLMNDNIATTESNTADTITTKASAISIFSRGRIYKDKWGFFIRYDYYDPTSNNQNDRYVKYSPLTATYDPNTREQFFTVGLDYSPISKVHIMPNIWYNVYNNAGPQNLSPANGNDVVLRLSLYYVYGR